MKYIYSSVGIIHEWDRALSCIKMIFLKAFVFFLNHDSTCALKKLIYIWAIILTKFETHHGPTTSYHFSVYNTTPKYNTISTLSSLTKAFSASSHSAFTSTFYPSSIKQNFAMKTTVAKSILMYSVFSCIWFSYGNLIVDFTYFLLDLELDILYFFDSLSCDSGRETCFNQRFNPLSHVSCARVVCSISESGNVEKSYNLNR